MRRYVAWMVGLWALCGSSLASAEVYEERADRNEYMITAHARAVAVPGFILGIWFDEHATHWSDGKSNMAYGGSFSWRKRGDFELSFSFDWADLAMSPAFWREKNDPINETRYTEVNLQMASFVFASYWLWDIKPWLTTYVGGGLGVGVVMGDIVKYRVRRGSACEQALGGANPLRPPECYGDDGTPNNSHVERDNPERDDIPSILPILHAAGGVRFNIKEYGVIKLELGLNDYVYTGISIGGQWW